jgi:hypothetical protein
MSPDSTHDLASSIPSFAPIAHLKAPNALVPAALTLSAG